MEGPATTAPAGARCPSPAGGRDTDDRLSGLRVGGPSMQGCLHPLSDLPLPSRRHNSAGAGEQELCSWSAAPTSVSGRSPPIRPLDAPSMAFNPPTAIMCPITGQGCGLSHPSRQPRSSAPPSKSKQPLLLSSALPPIPARTVEKIRSWAFVEMRELLPDNVALLQRLQEMVFPRHPPPANPSCLRDIQDPLSWAACFMAFVAT